MCGMIVCGFLFFIAIVGVFSAASWMLGSFYEVYERAGILGFLALVAFIIFCVWLASQSNGKDGKK